jgi:hypothetical protein
MLVYISSSTVHLYRLFFGHKPVVAAAAAAAEGEEEMGDVGGVAVWFSLYLVCEVNSTK